MSPSFSLWLSWLLVLAMLVSIIDSATNCAAANCCEGGSCPTQCCTGLSNTECGGNSCYLYDYCSSKTCMTVEATTPTPTTAEPTTSEPTTSEPTTQAPTTAEPTTSEPTEQLCPSGDTDTFDWNTLTEDGTDIPIVTFNMSVDRSDLSLNIEVEVQYIVNAYADYQTHPQFATTYVLDFEDFDAHKSSIALPGSCANRLETDYGTINSNQYFEISSETFNAIGTDENMCYPPAGGDSTGWNINKGESNCKIIKYIGSWTWEELRNCKNNANTARGLQGRDAKQTFVDNTDPNWLELSGTFYINMVSPYWYENNDAFGDFYRVYQLVSQPFIIQVSKSVYVIGKTGINVMTMSVIAVYKENQDSDYTLVLLTETAEYMQLNNAQWIGFDGDNSKFDTLTVATAAETQNEGCLNNKAYICSQLWKVFATETECDEDNGGTDFSGIYQLKFDPQCRQSPVNGNQGYDFSTHCETWLNDHSDFNAGNEGVLLESELTFVDAICDPKIFKVQLLASMTFYGTDYNDEITNDASHLYEVGVDTVYVQITLDFPSNTELIFDSKLVNVWLCTFAPDINVTDPNQNGPNTTDITLADNGGCFSAERDGFSDGENSDFFFHIFSSQSAVSAEDFSLTENGNEASDRVRFEFTVPSEIQRDTLYVHAQVEVLLEEITPSQRRRVLLLDVSVPKGKTSNKMSHFGRDIGISNNKQTRNKEPKPGIPQMPNEPNLYVPNGSESIAFSLTSKWVMIIGGLLALILVFNIAFMTFMNCCKRGRNGRAYIAYDSVKCVDSNEESIADSEANLIEVDDDQ